MSPLTEPTRIILRKGWQPMDPDAAAYISAVETADGQALEEPVKIAIDNFVLGCKADGIWDAIKASCIMAGARTLNGALVPLVGTAPTNFNFVADDYNRKTGLVGDGSTKYLNSNRLANSDSATNCHLSCFITTAATASCIYLGVGAGGGPYHMLERASATQARVYPAGPVIILNVASVVDFIGTSRSSSNSSVGRANGAFVTSSSLTISNYSESHFVFARNLAAGFIAGYSNARLAFYSIGESLDLALLDARVTDLINKFAEVLP